MEEKWHLFVDEVIEKDPSDDGERAMRDLEASAMVVKETVSKASFPPLASIRCPLRAVELPVNSILLIVVVDEDVIVRNGEAVESSFFELYTPSAVRSSPVMMRPLLIVMPSDSAVWSPVTMLTVETSVQSEVRLIACPNVAQGRSSHPHVDMSAPVFFT